MDWPAGSGQAGRAARHRGPVAARGFRWPDRAGLAAGRDPHRAVRDGGDEARRFRWRRIKAGAARGDPRSCLRHRPARGSPDEVRTPAGGYPGYRTRLAVGTRYGPAVIRAVVANPRPAG